MGYYNYKRVMHRDGYDEVAARVLAEERENYPDAEDSTYECDYDGGGWSVVERWLDEKDAEVAALAKEVGELRLSALANESRWLETESLLRAEIAKRILVASDMERQRDKLPSMLLHAYRGVEAGDECPNCDGWGRRVYGSTATWRGGVGGQAMTGGVCDACWGSGSRALPWPSWRGGAR